MLMVLKSAMPWQVAVGGKLLDVQENRLPERQAY